MSEWSQSDNHSNVRLMFNQHWRPGVTVSSLVIQRVNKSHNGIFQCSPSNSEAKTIKVHVLEGEIYLDWHFFCTMEQIFRELEARAVLKAEFSLH